jgi:hypothetical protein
MKRFIILLLIAVKTISADAQPTKGTVKVVNAFADYKVKKVDCGEDFKIRIVEHSPYNNYEWQFVECFENFTVQFVDAFEDYRVKFEYEKQPAAAEVQAVPMYEYTPPNYVKPITPPVDSLWQIQDSIRRRREDSVKQRELMLKKYFWPEDF